MYVLQTLRVQNEEFSEEKGFIIRDAEKEVCTFRRNSNPRSMDFEANSLPLSYPTCWWMGIKEAYIKSQIICLEINQVYAFVTKWQNWTKWNKINISFRRCLFDKKCGKKVTKKGGSWVFWKIFFSSENELTFCDVRLLLIGNRRSLLYQ